MPLDREQHGIDQPTGIRQALDLLSAKLNSRHEAQRGDRLLGQMVWGPNVMASGGLSRNVRRAASVSPRPRVRATLRGGQAAGAAPALVAPQAQLY